MSSESGSASGFVSDDASAESWDGDVQVRDLEQRAKRAGDYRPSSSQLRPASARRPSLPAESPPRREPLDAAGFRSPLRSERSVYRPASSGASCGTEYGYGGERSILEDSGLGELTLSGSFIHSSPEAPAPRVSLVREEEEIIRESLSLAAPVDRAVPVRTSLQAESVRESLSLTPPKPPLAPTTTPNPREGEAGEVNEEGALTAGVARAPGAQGVRETDVEEEGFTVRDGGHNGGEPIDLLPHATYVPRSPQHQLSVEELGFLNEMLEGEEEDRDGRGGGTTAPSVGGRVGVGVGGSGGGGGGVRGAQRSVAGVRRTSGEVGSRDVTRPIAAASMYADPAPGTLDRLLRAEIQSELQQDDNVDFTHLSACSRSEVGAELSFAALNEQAMEELGERLRALLARIAEEQERGNRRRALALMEESLGVRLEMEGPQGRSVLDLCEELAKEYNVLGLRLLEAEQFDASYEMFKKAEMLTAPGNALAEKPETRMRLRAITFNNLGCYYKQRGKLHAALHYLERTVKIEEAADIGAVENPASTHLNIAATLSTLGRHSAAVEYANEAVELLKGELAVEGGAEVMAETDRLMREQPGDATLAAKLSILAVALYNQAVEMEHLGQASAALLAYTQAAYVARQSSGPQSPMAIMLHKAQAAYRKKTGQMQSRRLQSSRPARRSSLTSTGEVGSSSGNNGSGVTGTTGRSRPESAPTAKREARAPRGPVAASRPVSGVGSKPQSGRIGGKHDGGPPAAKPQLRKTNSLPSTRREATVNKAAATSTAVGRPPPRKPAPTSASTRSPSSVASAADPEVASSPTTVKVIIRLRKLTPSEGIAQLASGALYKNGELLSR